MLTSGRKPNRPGQFQDTAPHTGLLLSAAVLVACNGILGLDERPGREGAGGTTSGGGSGDCDGQSCFQPPPQGFSGPILFSQGESVGALGSCAGSYANELYVVQASLVDAPHTCSCLCDPAVGVTCTTAAVTSWANPDCTGELQVDTFTDVAQCVEIHDDTRSASFPPPVANTTGASCTASAGPMVVPDLEWAAHGRACGPVTDLDRAPAGFDVCVYVTGDVPCVGDWYTQRTLWFGDVDDTRGCVDDCSCGAVDAQCNPVMLANGGHSCNESPDYPVPLAPGCVEGYFDSAELVSMAAAGTCAPGTATATGSIIATDPTTVCCHR